MITFLIDQTTKQRIEVLDSDCQFIEGQHMLIPVWNQKRMIVSEIVLASKVEGDPTIGLRASIIQNVFVKPYEQEENESTIN